MSLHILRRTNNSAINIPRALSSRGQKDGIRLGRSTTHFWRFPLRHAIVSPQSGDQKTRRSGQQQLPSFSSSMALKAKRETFSRGGTGVVWDSF